MLKLTLEEIIQKIQNEEVFEAVVDDYSFTLKIEDYQPYFCAAIHDGHQFRKELWENCLHTEYERWFEEDPCTKDFINHQPIVLASCDSRFEYDLNRDPESAIFDTAWGKQLWKKPLDEKTKSKSLIKHSNFYKVVDALVHKLEEKFSTCLVIDMHSYNWVRWDREVPTFNIGTININNEKYGNIVESWKEMLSKATLPSKIKSSANINDTFQGNGYLLKHITQHFNNTLVLATEVKKIYCDELNQIIYPEVVSALSNHFANIIPQIAKNFYTSFNSK